MFGLYFIIDMELSQSCRKEIKAGCKHLLYPDSRMVVSALWHVLSDDPIFLPVDIPFALSYIYIPILFYNIVYYLAYLGKKRNFPVLNYIWPVPTLAIILITTAWMSPPEGGLFTRLSLFERYPELFMSSSLLRFITAIAYIVPTGL